MAREVVLGAGRLCTAAKMVAVVVAVVPILAPETQTSDTAPTLETLEYSPARIKCESIIDTSEGEQIRT